MRGVGIANNPATDLVRTVKDTVTGQNDHHEPDTSRDGEGGRTQRRQTGKDA